MVEITVPVEFERMTRTWPSQPGRVEVLLPCELCYGSGVVLGEFVFCCDCDGAGSRWTPLHWVARAPMETRPERMLLEPPIDEAWGV